MPIVIDANVAIAWFLTKPSKVAENALDAVAAEGAIVPPLWRWQVQDVLRRLDLAGRLTKPVDFIRTELRELPITVDDGLTNLFGNEAAIAARYNLTLYDATSSSWRCACALELRRRARRSPPRLEPLSSSG